ncbi:hypothetical protein LJC68_06840 [Bacteroidales bacterium OttesenSCG-928-B11]|nr:hypothetical protein [Bacteroidales bacterium OttesenSCG-928-E04]MDL2312577.1 hypothetical protein [Bacteroidales bacterium OttesenSCG-928-B11]MDL2325647.1 hypothetical protein [Bacteroidales bacterium OttesenSCG-928-A14]
MSQRKREIIASVLTFIFVLYYANISLFYHSHNIDGFTIFHSHMHNATHAQNGTHSASEISLISALSSFQSLQAVVFLFGIGLFLFSTIIFQAGDERKVISTVAGNPCLRAPPVSI